MLKNVFRSIHFSLVNQLNPGSFYYCCPGLSINCTCDIIDTDKKWLQCCVAQFHNFIISIYIWSFFRIFFFNFRVKISHCIWVLSHWWSEFSFPELLMITHKIPHIFCIRTLITKITQFYENGFNYYIGNAFTISKGILVCGGLEMID